MTDHEMMAPRQAVITGAASGIGLALAQALAVKGSRIILADIDMARANAEAAAIRANGGDAIAIYVDHADHASIDALADAAFAHGPIDLVVANAGVGAGGPLHSARQANIDWVFAVNLMGPIHMARAFMPRLIEQGTPSRFAMTASEHSLGLPSRGGQVSVYTVSKQAVFGVAQTMKRDLAGTVVAVSVICPAVVTTDIWNPFRTRHERFGGPRTIAERPASQIGLDPAVAAARILDAFAAGEFIVLTHGRDVAEVHGERSAEVNDALARFAERYGAEA
jgi:NAD(P)-dependent dehydrogenase (short-subunit alcohol dehydrogenase family)